MAPEQIGQPFLVHSTIFELERESALFHIKTKQYSVMEWV